MMAYECWSLDLARLGPPEANSNESFGGYAHREKASIGMMLTSVFRQLRHVSMVKD